jgi:hypothetical protein
MLQMNEYFKRNVNINIISFQLNINNQPNNKKFEILSIFT